MDLNKQNPLNTMGPKRSKRFDDFLFSHMVLLPIYGVSSLLALLAHRSEGFLASALVDDVCVTSQYNQFSQCRYDMMRLVYK